MWVFAGFGWEIVYRLIDLLYLLYFPDLVFFIFNERDITDIAVKFVLKETFFLFYL